MNNCFKVTDLPRGDAPDTLADLPLTTIAWRALRKGCQAKAADEKIFQHAIRGIAEEIMKLDRILLQQKGDMISAAGGEDKRSWPDSATPNNEKGTVPVHGEGHDNEKDPMELEGIVAHLKQLLADIGLLILSPQGREYDDKMMEYFDNIAQKIVPGLQQPLIGEVMVPAVIYRGTVLQMGKAIIHLPGQDEMHSLLSRF
jgi:hypothetical protein